jgi:hypothetical protein
MIPQQLVKVNAGGKASIQFPHFPPGTRRSSGAFDNASTNGIPFFLKTPTRFPLKMPNRDCVDEEDNLMVFY